VRLDAAVTHSRVSIAGTVWFVGCPGWAFEELEGNLLFQTHKVWHITSKSRVAKEN
jgi:hypothetical protein